MSLQVVVEVKICPGCGTSHQPGELYCEHVFPDGRECGYDLTDVRSTVPWSAEETITSAVEATPPETRCLNGHPLDAGDQFCMTCGAEPAIGDVSPAETAEANAEAPAAATVIAGWLVTERMPLPETSPWERFVVEPEQGGRRALLTLYHENREPDLDVYAALRRMDLDHVPEVLATGTHDGRVYDVVELLVGGSVADSMLTPDIVQPLVSEIGKALRDFNEVGLRHRDIRPETILARSVEPLDLVITGFGSARLSDFDLESVAPLKLTRYSAPEAVVGAVSAASDWWSLGMIVLECATRGACFEGINDQAFMLHVVTRGMELPSDLDPDVRLLLRGLLVRDPSRRWSWPEVKAWLDGEAVEAPAETVGGSGEAARPIILGGRQFSRRDAFALAAAEAANWDEARDMSNRGVLAQWLDETGADAQIVAEVRRSTADEELDEDQRHALALMAINRDLPFVLKGEIVTPAWLLAHPEEGYRLVMGPVTRHLERMGREPLLVRLRSRAEAVREKARLLEVELDEPRIRTALLATSRANLDAEWDRLRNLFPDTEHGGLNSLIERARPSDEDLIILLGAAITQYVPLAQLTDSAMELASRTGIVIDRDTLPGLLTKPRREIFATLDEHTANFARCGIQRADEWADGFRVERRTSLARAAVLLSVPKDQWREPPKHQYVASLLEHFEKRVVGTIARGPLVRFIIGKFTPRVDMTELGVPDRTAEALINHVISRTDVQVTLDPSGYGSNEQTLVRMRRLVNQASTFKRDTGIDGRYVGFPFILARESRSASASGTGSVKIAPVLLWPVAFDMPPGVAAEARLGFDREREEVRLNPGLENIVGAVELAKWRAARDDILARGSIRLADVIDAFSHLAQPTGRTLTRVPPKETKVPAGTLSLVPAATLFNAEFTGQAIAEDLRQMRNLPLAGTVLEAALRISEQPTASEAPAVPERDRYLTVASDPSQENAVLRSGLTPGLVVEGPPGTGKSQTIVNIVANAIGHGQTVLVVCQKQAALQVVKKRLEADAKLKDRLFALQDINKDRTAVVTALREQLGAVLGASDDRTRWLRRQRDESAGRIETLERELDRHHEAQQHMDDATGLSYRTVLSELMRTEAAGPYIQAFDLRAVIGRLSGSELSALEETCGPLARTWFASGFEKSPLAPFRQFAVDDGTKIQIGRALASFIETEDKRHEIVSGTESGFETEDPETVRAWLSGKAPTIEGLGDEARSRLAAWLGLFRVSAGERSKGDTLVEELDAVVADAEQLDGDTHQQPLFELLASKTDTELAEMIADIGEWIRKPSFFERLKPSRWRMRSRVKAFATGFQVALQAEALIRLRSSAELEVALRPLRSRLGDTLKKARPKQKVGKPTLEQLIETANALAAELRAARDAAAAAFACPAPDIAIAAVESGERGKFASLLTKLEAGCVRCDARRASLAALDGLASWFQEATVSDWRQRIERADTMSASVRVIASDIGRLRPYQLFRLRSELLTPVTMETFAALRQEEAALAPIPAPELDGLVRRTIRREALLSAKFRLEGSLPELLYEREELDSKLVALERLDGEFRDMNKKLLSGEITRSRLGSRADWENVTRLQGPRARRLREILEMGADLGLMHLRPVWLMIPDVASRILPRRAGLFDLVVYDEASQMPVEHAVPTMFRGKRAVISGDEKQMPPSNFFAASMSDEDEDVLDVEIDDCATESEKVAFEEGWNKREIKDCPDLLQLGRSTLPVASLQIHYRSRYRELIGFSNAAYYRGTLSVPVRHPLDEIRRAKPIEVIRVDGTYSNQTNREEAQRVVEVLGTYWLERVGDCPSIGVVTFNRKQADLIDDAIDERAGQDDAFAAALRRERDRVQDGEDMGFFVKNVENVQGDERDVIIFSTTFGRDANGTFRRQFGVLGLGGGERRLNVAVTRAREKVVMVTSMPTKAVSDWLSSHRAPSGARDYLQAYLEYAARVDACDVDGVSNILGRLTPRQLHRDVDGFEWDGDGFARAVEGYLRELGYDPVPFQEAGDAFSVDFAIVDARTGLFGIGIECDAPAHSLLDRARAREIWRRSVLGRAIPVTHRVSSRDWYHHPEEERNRLKATLSRALEGRQG